MCKFRGQGVGVAGQILVGMGLGETMDNGPTIWSLECYWIDSIGSGTQARLQR